MLTQAFTDRLHKLSGPNCVLTDAADCWPYGYDNSRRHALPEAVVFAQNHNHVRDVVRLCNEFTVTLTPRGRGTGTTGATVPVRGGLVLSMERMDAIVEIDPANRIMVVEPGITNQAVQDAAFQHGFFWPPDPTSAAYCTIGGNLAYNSAGPKAVKYGTPRENTLGLRAVTGSGNEIRTGVKTTKGVVGLDLTRLLIGSEGLLAIITEATLKLTPHNEHVRTLRAIYNDVHAAAHAVTKIMAQPTVPRVVEFMDAMAIEMIRDYSQANLPMDAGALLMIEVDEHEACIDTAAETVAQAAQVDGCLQINIARDSDEIQQLWATRKALSPALRTIAPGKINEDVVVPVSRMAELVTGLRSLSEKHRIPIVNFGHAGNGNIHVNLLLDPDNADEIRRAEKCLDEVFTLVLKLHGSLSGEHGIGLVKRAYVNREIDAASLSLMRGIKRQFDPNEILNPEKLFSPE